MRKENLTLECSLSERYPRLGLSITDDKHLGMLILVLQPRISKDFRRYSILLSITWKSSQLKKEFTIALF